MKRPLTAIARGYKFVRPLAFHVDAEDAHDRTITLLSVLSTLPAATRLLESDSTELDSPRLLMPVPGIGPWFPVGIAAGLDKDARFFPSLLALGFGFVEIGTVTPIPQAGNPRPRVFRLPQDQALINRMGFPGLGSEAAMAELAKRRQPGMKLGINIGPNKTSVDSGRAIDDIVLTYRRLAPMASYICINVSSPNTAGLRALQQKQPLLDLLSAVTRERARGVKTPIFAKISPDLDDHALYNTIDAIVTAGIDGVVATNTTISRPPTLRSPFSNESGGLSGKPLAKLSQQTVAHIAAQTGGSLPIIAVGGIFTGQDVLAAIASGASAVQLYTSLIYRGPGIAVDIANELLQEMDNLGITTLDSIRGQSITQGKELFRTQ